MSSADWVAAEATSSAFVASVVSMLSLKESIALFTYNEVYHTVLNQWAIFSVFIKREGGEKGRIK